MLTVFCRAEFIERGLERGLSAGDAYGDETRRVIFQMHIPESAGLGVDKVADVIVRYLG